VILDNCEHVKVKVAALARVLLSGCALLRILATSREPLRIAGEETYRLPSRIPKGHEIAIRLYAQRAQAVDRGFALSPDR